MTDALWQSMLRIDRAIGSVFELSPDPVPRELQDAFDECTAAMDEFRDVLTKGGHAPK